MSTMSSADHRLVQTAVVGSPGSDHPVILPMDAHELSRWRSLHPSYTYYCGIQLGGCGWKLTDKLYGDRVCHFAHVEGGPTCTRTALGESSADHLFVKRGIRRLMDRHKMRGTVETRDLGTGPGDVVEVRIPGARRRLRFQFSPLDYGSWRDSTPAPGEEIDSVDWFFGSDGPLTKNLLDRHSYTLRFRLDTHGGERRVSVGAHYRDEPAVSAWTPLDACELRPEGLWTPAVEKIRKAPPALRAAGFPLQSGFVFAFAPEAPVPDSFRFGEPGRRLVMADVKPVASPIIRAVLSLPDDIEIALSGHVYRSPEHARLLVTESGTWAVRLDRYVRLNANEADRTGLARIAPRTVAPVLPKSRQQSSESPKIKAIRDPREARPNKRRGQPAATPSVRQAEAPTTSSYMLPRMDAISRTRRLLRRAAAEQETIAWRNVAAGLGRPYRELSGTSLVDFLAQVDSPLWANTPVLTALLTENDGPLSCFPDVLRKLGVQGASRLSPTSPALRRWIQRERERAFAMQTTPRPPLPPRIALNAGARRRKSRNRV
ncbi:hypothetical protein AB0E83_11470 [Streptomyces sp. NPDC035033]|uniref:hypothetical protein n=1 Tax=Streptomyces sp. NPDC035033 TaxID=3155368 RepID=UPI0033E2BD3B